MIDINCDIGEGYGNDHLILPLITSCSIACGGHFGDESTIEKTILLAAENNVKIGAHPSYPDKFSFGRKSMNILHQSVIDRIQFQLDVFFNIASKLNIIIHHIKPLGALYNDVYKIQDYWDAFKKLSQDYPFEKYYVLANCNKHIQLGQGKLYWQEGFGDRNYNSDDTLQSRTIDGALIQDFKIFKDHVDLILKKFEVKNIDNEAHRIQFDTLCIHGDHPCTLDFLNYINSLKNE